MKRYKCYTCNRWIRKLPCVKCGSNHAVPCSTVKNNEYVRFCKRCKQRFECYTNRKKEWYYSMEIKFDEIKGKWDKK